MGRNYSDDEDEEQYFYDRSSELMSTELASERKSKSEPVKKLMRAAPKVGARASVTGFRKKELYPMLSNAHT